MLKAFAMHFFYVLLYIIYSICSIRKSMKQHFFTNSEAATGGVLQKKVFLEISQNSQQNICVRVPFLIKFQASACNFIKKQSLAQVFSCEFCDIYKNTVLTKHFRTTASTNSETYFEFQISVKKVLSEVKIKLISDLKERRELI